MLFDVRAKPLSLDSVDVIFLLQPLRMLLFAYSISISISISIPIVRSHNVSNETVSLYRQLGMKWLGGLPSN